MSANSHFMFPESTDLFEKALRAKVVVQHAGKQHVQPAKHAQIQSIPAAVQRVTGRGLTRQMHPTKEALKSVPLIPFLLRTCLLVALSSIYGG